MIQTQVCVGCLVQYHPLTVLVVIVNQHHVFNSQKAVNTYSNQLSN